MKILKNLLNNNYYVQDKFNQIKIKYLFMYSTIVGGAIVFYNFSDHNLTSYKMTRIASRFSGFLSQIYIPQFSRKIIFEKFSKVYNVDLNDIEKDLEDFENFNQFFTRKIKERKFEKNDKNILCPTDSQILEIDEVTEDKVLLVKNQNYNLGELLYGKSNIKLNKEVLDQLKSNKNNKIYSVIFYLCPGDYHRFHSPSKFTINNINHIIGNLYPVKISYIEKNKVYEYNERISVFGKSPLGLMTYVAVGATNVGSINLSFDENIKTNKFNKPIYSSNIIKYNKPKFLDIGEELGLFNLGSTIVMIFEVPKNFKFLKKSNEIVKYGDILGKIN